MARALGPGGRGAVAATVIGIAGVVAVLVGEMDAMRARLNNIENEILDLKLGRLPVGLPKPNELPAELEGV